MGGDRKMKNIKACLMSTHNNWSTPRELYEDLDKEFNFDFDPCPLHSDFDGLLISWGGANFVNPPYSTKLQDAFIKKGLEESRLGKVVVFLLPVRTGSKRWQDIILPFANEIRLIRGRLKFGGSSNSAPFDSAIIIFKGGKKKK